MKSIEAKVVDSQVEKKSKFITYLFPLTKEEDISTYLNEIKEKEKGATHYCYAYLMNQVKRFSDDGEPSGTAGMPILHVLEKEELNYILAVVVRYFGGIKLGAGGLVRAYSNCVSKAIEKSNILELTMGFIISITFSYEQEKDILFLLQPYPILKKEYQEKVTYQLFIPNEYLSKLESYSYQIIEKNILGPKRS